MLTQRTRTIVGAGVVMAAAALAAGQDDPNLNPGVHPATVLGPGKPTDKTLVAPPPGWQLARPMHLGGRLYYAVHDADAYLAQAGWTRAAVVYPKERTGFRFDLILVPGFDAGSAVRRYSVGGQDRTISIGGTGYGIGWSWDWWYDPIYNTGGYTGPIDGQLSPGYQPAVEPPPEPVVLTTLERAAVELAFGDADRAVELYRLHLGEDPADVGAMRALAVALVKAGRFEDAAATVRLAYVTDPTLAQRPVSPTIAGEGALDARRIRTAAAGHAGRVDTASAWLMVAVLLQGERMPEAALRVLDRAEGHGLEPAVASALRGELTGR